MNVLACDLEALVPFVPNSNIPWDSAAVQHLHRRLGYGLSPNEVNAVLGQNPQAHISSQLNTAASLAPFAMPSWGDWTLSDYTDQQQFIDQMYEWRAKWVDDMRDEPWRAKMVLFWHNHFVTSQDKYNCPSWMYGYLTVLQTYAFGDFREFVRAIGKTPAMLIYLDGVQNVIGASNENYARELFELFTLGESNGYTQNDIVNAARALTGWNGYTELCAPITYVPALHDNGLKTIFGETQNFNYDQLIDLIFEKRAVECSTYICRKLYVHFVSPEADETIVEQLATTLRTNDWNLLPVYQQLFSSAHFFSPPLYGARIRDPFELFIGSENVLATAALRTPEYTLAGWFAAGNLGQMLFNPPDVAGWPGNRAWLNANLLSLRAQVTEAVVFLSYEADREQFVPWARSIGLTNEGDVNLVTREIADFVLPKGLDNELEYQRAIDVMRGEVPAYYFDSGIWSLDFEYANEQIAVLLNYLMYRPEFQLC